jgi:hypothetical protein
MYSSSITTQSAQRLLKRKFKNTKFSQQDHIIVPVSHVVFPISTKASNKHSCQVSSNWPFNFGEDRNVKSLQTTTTTDDYS